MDEMIPFVDGNYYKMFSSGFCFVVKNALNKSSKTWSWYCSSATYQTWRRNSQENGKMSDKRSYRKMYWASSGFFYLKY